MKKRISILLILCCSLATFSQKTNYYVSNKSGSDDNNGLSEQTAFKTLKKALSSFNNDGGTCYITEGTYHENITVSDKKNITLTNYNNKRVVIDGTRTISSNAGDWKLSQGRDNIYEIQLTQDIWQLFINNEQQVMARWPNAQFKDQSVFNQGLWAKGKKESTNGHMIVDSDSSNPDLASISKNLTGAMMIGNVGSWTSYAREITSHNIGGNVFDYGTVPNFKNNHIYFYLECHLDLLDTENEWFYDKDTKKLYVYGNPTGKNIKGKVQTYAFSFKESSNITFKGLSFFATTIAMYRSKESTIEECTFSFPSCSKRMLKSEGTPKATALEAKQPHSTGKFTIKKTLFEHIDGEAMFLKGTHNTIENCYFQYIDYSCASIRYNNNTLVGLGGYFSMKNSTMHTTGASETINSRHVPYEFSYNDISKTGLVQSDGAIYSISRGNKRGSRIHHNWLHDSRKTGIRYDAPFNQSAIGGTHAIVDHNVIWNCSKGMMIKGNFHHIYNNTAFNNGSIDLTIINEGMTDPNDASQKIYSNPATITRNNLAGKISGHRKNPVNTSPSSEIPGVVNNNIYSETSTALSIKTLLEDTDSRDFSPKATSTELINTGVIDDSTTNDPEINATTPITDDSVDLPDIGAYEFNGDKWVAGIYDWTPDFFPWKDWNSLGSTDSTPPLNSNEAVKISPNPSNGLITIESNVHQIISILITNSIGQIILQEDSINLNEKNYDIKNVSSGLYLVSIIIKNGRNIRKKIIIE